MHANLFALNIFPFGSVSCFTLSFHNEMLPFLTPGPGGQLSNIQFFRIKQLLPMCEIAISSPHPPTCSQWHVKFRNILQEKWHKRFAESGVFLKVITLISFTLVPWIFYS